VGILGGLMGQLETVLILPSSCCHPGKGRVIPWATVGLACSRGLVAWQPLSEGQSTEIAWDFLPWGSLDGVVTVT
jgi:hypothetical protein